ncbi:SDR family NAD(P)-dependent oxidoreductase [Clostridium transplantifaecale]|uniref:SDR family NAD(P)-dependent oxidoreductase n=1 Tax=Clostridium transplantifaecale TaxID=2479838 RepID=UPI000F642D2E|nr:SDR family NAD(P)-dependent oxidoreductase [Clostridium transplantifaecale]
MEKLLEEKICLITGAGRGIGRAIAELFAELGATVYANDSREGCMDDWIREFDENLPGKIRAAYFDITDEAAVKTAVMRIKKECGRIDVLINNAGVEFNELIGMISRKNMDMMFNVNVIGTINMLQTVGRVMWRQPGGGSIVNISSMVGVRGNRGQLVYSATKGAVISLTKSAAKELAEKKIRVNAIAPGLTRTPMMEQADQDKLEARIKNVCMGRLAEPKDIARACVFFASDLSEYVSGQTLAVDGCTIM